MSLVVAGMGSNVIRSHFFLQPEADPDCDFMSFIFLRATEAFMLLEQLASLSDDWSMLQKSSCFCLKKLNHLSMLIKSYADAVTLFSDFFQFFLTSSKNCS